MAGKDELEYPYEASDEASESELLDRSLSFWSGPSCFGGDDFTPIALDLHTASSIGHYECVRNIIEKREEDLNRKNHGGWTALMYASYIGYDTVVNLLLEAGVSVNTRNNMGTTSLMLAASCGNESVAYFLLQQGAEIEANDNRSWTALFHATFSGHQNMVKFLLDNDANMDAVDKREMTPFMEAAAAGHEIIVQYFLQSGVNVSMKNCSGDTARSLALMKGHRKIVSLIDNYSYGSYLPLRKTNHDSNFSVECLSSSDEAFPNGMKRPASRRPRQNKIKGASIQDGPEAVEAYAKRHNLTVKRPVNSAIVPQDYVAFTSSVADDSEVQKNFRYRDVTSPINVNDHKLDSSGGKDSLDNDEDCNVFSQTGALTIRSSSSSSSGLAAALKICQEEISLDGAVDTNSNQNSTQNERVNGKVEQDASPACTESLEVSAPPPHRQPPWTGPVRNHGEMDSLTNNPGGICLGFDRDSLVSLNPRALTRQAYAEQIQMLQQRPQNLAELLHDLNLSKYLPVFEEQDVDLQVFLSLTDNDLHEIGIKLFGPRKKMNVAIARWHSNARPSGNDLEQAYADKLETEMQEMAIQLHQANNVVEQMRHQLVLEQELRSVTEACLMEDRATSQQICELSADNLKQGHSTRDLLTSACRYTNELSQRLTLDGDIRGQPLAAGNRDACRKDVKTAEQPHTLEDARNLLAKLKNCHQELSQISVVMTMNTETILKKQFKTIKPGFTGAPPR